MKICSHCGKEVADDCVICLGCGCYVCDEVEVNFKRVEKSPFWQTVHLSIIGDRAQKAIALKRGESASVRLPVGSYRIEADASVLAEEFSVQIAAPVSYLVDIKRGMWRTNITLEKL